MINKKISDQKVASKNYRLIKPRLSRLSLIICSILYGSGIGQILYAAPLVLPNATTVRPILPQGCNGGCGGNRVFVGAGDITGTILKNGIPDYILDPENNTYTMTIHQQSEKAILNWQSFDIGAGNTVHFDQKFGSKAIALNRIYQGRQSVINGNLTATGKIYVLNQNGFLFGDNANVDVHTLITSSLNVSDDIFNNGILSSTNGKITKPAFEPFLDANGNPVQNSGAINIAAGATLTSQSGGSIMVFAPNIVNAGTIETPDGQAVLAAGEKIWLTSSTDLSLRGLIVEVEVPSVDEAELNDYLNGSTDSLSKGTVRNVGKIIAKRGNISIVGLAVNQDGLVSASTTVDANGSIKLVARDSVFNASTLNLDAGRDGRVDFGENSLTEILPELTDLATAVDEKQQTQSLVEVSARQIHLRNNARIIVPGGDVNLTAQDSSILVGVNSTKDVSVANARVQLDSGSVIDVSGSNETLQMSRNQLEVKLFDELKDVPLQRNGFLRGKTIFVDLRDVNKNGQIPIADVSGAINTIQRTVAERTSEGGHVNIDSQGSIVFQEDATINVSGGTLHYDEGFVKTTKLISNGELFEIGNANPNRIYDGIYGQVSKRYERWGITKTWDLNLVPNTGQYYQAYNEGKDAGSVKFTAKNMLMEGNLIGHASNGIWQRELGKRAEGGELIIGFEKGLVETNDRLSKEFRAPNINFSQQSLSDIARQAQAELLSGDLTEEEKSNELKKLEKLTKVDFNDAFPNKLQDQLFVSTKVFSEGGFTKVNATSNGKITNQKIELDPITREPMLGAGDDLHLLAGSKLKFKAQNIELLGSIYNPGGDISLKIDEPNTSVSAKAVISKVATPTTGLNKEFTLALGDGVTLDTRGSWVNDLYEVSGSLPNDVVPLDGGNISLDTSKVTDGVLYLGNNVTLDASGGAWLQANNKLKSGKGGDISLKSSSIDSTKDLSKSTVVIGAGLTLKSESLTRGGKLTLSLPNITISGDHSAESLATQRAASQQTRAIGNTVQRQLDNGTTEIAFQNSLPQDSTGTPDQTAGRYQAFDIPASLFEQGGFSKYQIISNSGDLIVKSGTELTLNMHNRQFDAGFAKQATGADLRDFSDLVLLPDSLRKPTDLVLAVTGSQDISRYDLIIESGATISADPGAHIELESGQGGRLLVDGSIIAHGGQIDLNLSRKSKHEFSNKHYTWLGENSVLDVSGIFVPEINTQNRITGQVLDGGSINIKSSGYLITAQGSSLDVSGAQAQLDIQQGSTNFEPTIIASNAGKISLAAAEGMVLAGDMHAGVQHSTAQAGQLTILNDTQLLRGTIDGNPSRAYTSYNKNTEIQVHRRIQVQQAAVEGLAGFDPLSLDQNGNIAGIDSTLNGLTTISADQIQAGGFDQLTLKSPNGNHGISFKESVSLTLGRSIILETGLLTTDIQGVVNLDAPYVALGQDNFQTEQASSGGAQLKINANLIDLKGTTNLQGFSLSELVSKGDLRLRSNLDVKGIFNTKGEIALTADQIYPTTLSDFTLSSDVITIHPGDDSGHPIQSAGGRVVLEADQISQGGTLKAPLGEIQLGKADGSSQLITLLDGSVTSTSLENNTVLFGSTLNGTDWIYKTSDGEASTNDSLGQLPSQNMTLQADKLDVQDQAVINISGGGDLLAWEFIAGPGGSKDALLPKNATGLYAIVPGFGSAYAPFDKQESIGSNLQPGDSVYLDGINGLPAGEYALLPARYALLPGAFLIEQLDTIMPLGNQSSLLDGTPVIAGYRTVTGTSIRDNQSSAFAIRSGTYVHQLAEYRLNTASQFLPQLAAKKGIPVQVLPGDAGKLSLLPTSELIISGTLLGEGALLGTNLQGQKIFGQNAQVEISGDKLQITHSVDQNAQGYVNILASDLTALNAGSLLLGATQERDDKGLWHLNVVSQEVLIADNVILASSDLFLAASDHIGLGQNAHLKTSGEVRGLGGRKKIKVVGDAALLRLANGDQLDLQRESVSGAKGRISVAQNSTVSTCDTLSSELCSSQQSILYDFTSEQATGAIVLATVFEMNGGSLHLGGNNISLGDAPVKTEGIILSAQNLANLNNKELILSSRNSLDIYGALDLKLDKLSIDAAGIGGFQVGGETAVIAAKTMQIVNSSGTTHTSTANGVGSLSLEADTIFVGDSQSETSSSFAMSGFNDVTLHANNEILGSGKLDLVVSADLALQAQRISANSGAVTTIDANNHTVTITKLAASSKLVASTGLGAQLKITGSQIVHDGNIELHSGKVELIATGAKNILDSNSGAVTITKNGVLDVSGVDLTFADIIKGTDGGQVIIESKLGNINLEAASLINVSGAASGSDGGNLTLQATQGSVLVDGELLGNAQQDFAQAEFVLDSSGLSGAGNTFSTLNSKLNQGGFTGLRDFRLRTGDLTVATTDIVTAQKIHMSTDQGGITVQGELNASGKRGGEIQLYARDNVTLADAKLNAKGLDKFSEGGLIELGSTEGIIDFQGSTTLDVSGGVEGKGGEVKLRVARVDTNDDQILDGLAINGFSPNQIIGANNTVIKHFLTNKLTPVNGISTLTQTNIADYIAATDVFMANAGAIRIALGITDRSDIHLQAEIDILATGDLILAEDIDLFGTRFWNGMGDIADPANKTEIGHLSLRATGNVKLAGSVSDGFVKKSATVDVLQDVATWSFNFVAGADSTAANPLRVKQSVGNLLVATGVKIRTGDGDITAVAGNNIKLEGQDSVIYTAGRASGFALDGRDTNPFKFMPIDGGDVKMYAGNSIFGPGTGSDKGQLFIEWFESQKETEDLVIIPDVFVIPGDVGGWWVDYSAFKQNIAAFGGGDAIVVAKQDINRLSVSVPTTGYYDKDALQEVRVGQGMLKVQAGNDINSGIFLLGDGVGQIKAGGSIYSNLRGSEVKGAVIGMMGGQIDIRANNDITIAALYDPFTVTIKSKGQANNRFFSYTENSSINATSIAGDIVLGQTTIVLLDKLSTKKITFVADDFIPSELNLSAWMGKININGKKSLYPSSQSDFQLLANNTITLSGELSIFDFASQFIPRVNSPAVGNFYSELKFSIGKFGTTPTLHDKDFIPARIVTKEGDILDPSITSAKPVQLIAGRDIKRITFKVQNNHESDISRIQAGRDIIQSSARGSNSKVIVVNGSGRLDVLAGRDIDLGISKGIQTVGNVAYPGLAAQGADINILAGLGDSLPQYEEFIKTNARYFYVLHPQQDNFITQMRAQTSNLTLDLAAAIAAYNAMTITDKENLNQQFGISEQTVLAITDVDNYQSSRSRFINRIPVSTDITNKTEFDSINEAFKSYNKMSVEQQLAILGELNLTGSDVIGMESVEQFQQQVTFHFRDVENDRVLNQTQAVAMFDGLTAPQQQQFVLNAFFNELRSSGRSANLADASSSEKQFLSGYAAIDTLLPGSNDLASNVYGGDLNLFFSKIYSEDGGDIQIIVPGGIVNAGLATQPANAPNKKPSELGIVAQGAGNVRIFTRDDIQINQSRVFTLGGGDITMWSSFGNIDAGRGSKTAISAPPPTVTVDNFGNVTSNFGSAISGSGIRVIETPLAGIDCVAANSVGCKIAHKDVDLIAPEGVVDAGDAGIGAAGNLFIAAQSVVGADNIDVGGIAVGVQLGDSGGLDAGLAGASGFSSGVTKGAEETISSLGNDGDKYKSFGGSEAMLFLDVEVIGFGEDEDKNKK